jgi:predicted phosphodiesterase
VTADLGQDYALLAAHLDAILPMAYYLGYHGPQWVSEVVDYVYAKTHPGSPSCKVIPHVQTYQDNKDIEWPGQGELAAATDPIDYAKVGGLAFYSYENTSDNEWVEVKNSFDDNGTKTFSNEIIFGSTGTYDLKVEDITALRSDTQAGIVVFDGRANGTLIKTTTSDNVYFIQEGMKSLILTPSVFESRFDWNQIVTITTGEMSNYVNHTTEPNLHYREGTLFKKADNVNVYIVEEGKKRWIDSAATFVDKGYSWSNIVTAEAQSVFDAHANGADLTSGSTLPNGSVVKTASDSSVFYLDGGERRFIPSPTVYLSQFNWPEIITVSTGTLNFFPVGTPYLYRGGSIVRNQSDGYIYFIEGKIKRFFTTPMFYNGLGYDWSDYANAETASIFDYYVDGNDMYQLPKYIDVYGDTRSNPTAHQTMVNLMTNDKPYLVLHVGDLVNDGNSASDWATFDNITGNLRANTRFYPVIGNHEIASSYFEARFGTDKWKSYDIDNIHYIILDSNTSLASGSTQYNWLHIDLDAAVAAGARFTLVFFHHPPYTAGGLADAIVLFETHGVDAVFNGHTHLYARMIDTGIYYFIDGGGGAPLSSCPIAGYTDCHAEYEYIRLLLNNNRLELGVYNSSGVQIDSVDLVGV